MPHPRKPDPEKYCEYCGKRLTRNRYNGVLEDLQRFLSRKNCNVLCMARWMTKEKVTKSMLHKRATKFREARCEDCLTGKGLHVHHRDNNPSNNAPANLITLCGSCHLKLHWKNGKMIPKRPITFCTVCGRKAEGRGFCMNHYRHFMKYGNPLLTKRPGNSKKSIINELTGESIS